MFKRPRHRATVCFIRFRVYFERENDQLFTEMNSMVDEVGQIHEIEGKVLEISRLQEIFTENVLTQVKPRFAVTTFTKINVHYPHQLGQYIRGV